MNCLTRIFGILFFSTWLLAACTGGNGNYFSGHQVGIDRSGNILDLGEVRAELAVMRSARNFPIPETRYFAFEWIPGRNVRLLAESGWRKPTRADWQNALDRRLRETDWTRWGDPEAERQNLIANFQRLEAGDAAAGYISRVRPDGQIVQMATCEQISNTSPNCEDELNLSIQEKRELAQAVLTHFEPECVLGRIAPEEVTSLLPNYRSQQATLIASVICS